MMKVKSRTVRATVGCSGILMGGALFVALNGKAHSDTETPEERAKAVAAERLGISPEGVSVGGSSLAKAITLRRTGKTLTRFKAMGPAGEKVDVAFDAEGNVVDGEKLALAEEAAGRELLGKKTGLLHETLAKTSVSEKVSVSIWLAAPVDGGTQKPSIDGQTVARQANLDLDAQRAKVWRAKAHGAATAAAATARKSVLPALRAFDPSAHEASGSPIVYAKLNRAQIAAMEARPDVLSVDLGDIALSAALEVAADTQNWIPEVHTNLNIRGSGVKIAQLELNGQVLAHTNLTNVHQINPGACRGGGVDLDHATAVAGILKSNEATRTGVAPLATLEAGGGCQSSTNGIEADGDAARANGATVFNASYLGQTPTVSQPTNHDRYYDNLFSTYYITPVIAAGNQNGPCQKTGFPMGLITLPALGFNSITVGNFADQNSDSWSIYPWDIMEGCSSWMNPITTNMDREKPEIAASGTYINTTGPGNGFTSWTGTSFAAPMVAGAAALMQNAVPALTYWPEVIKAGLMATAHHNVEGAARLSEVDGAGGLDVNAAVQAMRGVDGNWRGDSLSCTSTWTLDMAMVANRRTRVAIVWHQDPNYASYADKPNADIDLQVNFPNGGWVRSNSYDNTFEILDFVAPVTGTYQAQAIIWRCDSSPKYIGAVWYQEP